MALRLQEALRQDRCPLSSGRTGHCSSSTLPLTLKLYFLLYSICTILHQKIKKLLPSPPTGSNIPNCSRTLMKRAMTTSTAIISSPSRLSILGDVCMSSPAVPPSRGWSETGQQHDRTQSEHSAQVTTEFSSTFLVHTQRF